MLDLAIDNARVIDGTGTPARSCNVGIKDGILILLGKDRDPAKKRLNAEGLILTPGFIDLHTHYDAQLSWDPVASPSPLHGVTTVIAGNCGFTLAPCAPDQIHYLMRMMARVEGMSLSALEKGLAWEWDSFSSFLSRLEGRIGPNAGFLVGHSTIRRLVMGERASEPEETAGSPSAKDISAMAAVVRTAIDEGALGLSTSRAPTHHDGEGRPVPSRLASDQELMALCEAAGQAGAKALEIILPGCINGFTEEEIDLLAKLSRLARCPVNWNVLGVSALNPQSTWRQLAASDEVAQRGGKLIALTLPHTMKLRLSFATGTILDGLPGWSEIFALAPEQRMRALSDPATRRRLDEGAHSPEAGLIGALANWGSLVLEEIHNPELADLEGLSVAEVAERRGCSTFDALLDVVIADSLATGIRPPIPEAEADWKLRAQVWRDPRAVIGGSDAGAHLDVMCGAIYSTALLAEGVRKRHLLSLEEAVRLLSDVPARLYGMKKRGRIENGYAADLVLLDPETVGHGPERTLWDLPSGAPRLYAQATGIEKVFVNGIPIVENGNFTGELPGSVLRT